MLKAFRKKAPKNLPAPVSDLIAEGGKVLASDDAPVHAPPVERRPATRLHLSDAGKWIARVLKS